MSNLPEFIELLRQIRDKYYVEIREMWDKVNTNKDKVEHIAGMMTQIHVSKTINVPNQVGGVVGAAEAHFDGNTGTFEFGIPQGIPGKDGPKGDQGVPGVQGVKGDQGNTGPRGNQGTAGVDGLQGTTGATGPQGIRGPEGPQGIQGIRGLRGQGLNIGRAYNTLADLLAAETNPQLDDIHLVLFKADGTTKLGSLYVFDNPTPPHDIAGAGWHDVGHIQGPEGPQGVQGIPGPQGAGVTVKGSDTEAVIKAKTGAASGDLWISTDDGHAWVWNGSAWNNVGAFKGEKGDQGVAGPQGLEGKQGQAGHDGPAGPQGNPGVKGDAGPQGPIGTTGAKGDDGKTGPEGPRGQQGIPGPIGNAGRDGVDGHDAEYATQADTDAETANDKAITPITLAGYKKWADYTPTANLPTYDLTPYAKTTDLSAYLPLIGGQLTGDLKTSKDITFNGGQDNAGLVWSQNGNAQMTQIDVNAGVLRFLGWTSDGAFYEMLKMQTWQTNAQHSTPEVLERSIAGKWIIEGKPIVRGTLNGTTLELTL